MRLVDDLEIQFGNSLPELNFLGLMMLDPVWGEVEHPASAFELVHVVHGRVDILMGGRQFHGDSGDTLLVPSSELHIDSFDPEEGVEIFYCSLIWPEERQFLRYVDNPSLLALPKDRKAALAEMFDRIRSDLRSGGSADRLLVRARLFAVLMFMLRELVSTTEVEETPPGARRRRQLMATAQAYLREHYSERVSLEDVASAANISPYYLSHLFRKESDFSLFGYLTALRMGRARELLGAGDLNISEVARAVGFESPNYFSKAFRKHVGCSPTDYIAAAMAT